MRGRASYFFGDRAWIRIKLPADIIGKPPAAFESLLPEGFKPASFGGTWRAAATDEAIHIERWSGPNPAESKLPDYEKPLFIEQDEDFEWSWRFWVGYRTFPNGVDESGETLYGHASIPDEWVAAYRAERMWRDKLHEYGNHPALDAFVEAGNHAKVTDFNLEGKHLEVVYGVKWFYPDRKLAFCRALSRALRKAEANGISTRVGKRG